MAYVTLLPLAALQIGKKKKEASGIPRTLVASIGVLLIIALIGAFQVQSGWLKLDSSGTEKQDLGRNDPSLDMFGWRQLREKMPAIIERDRRTGKINPDPVFISFRWFPLANIDYYIAKPLKMKVFAIGKLEEIHHYAWINELRGGFRQNMDAYYITSSRDYRDPLPLYSSYFKFIEPCDTIPVVRGGRVAMYFFIYRLHNLQLLPEVYPVRSVLRNTGPK
jgi:hypothetical protein